MCWGFWLGLDTEKHSAVTAYEKVVQVSFVDAYGCCPPDAHSQMCWKPSLPISPAGLDYPQGLVMSTVIQQKWPSTYVSQTKKEM